MKAQTLQFILEMIFLTAVNYLILGIARGRLLPKNPSAMVMVELWWSFLSSFFVLVITIVYMVVSVVSHPVSVLVPLGLFALWLAGTKFMMKTAWLKALAITVLSLALTLFLFFVICKITG